MTLTFPWSSSFFYSDENKQTCNQLPDELLEESDQFRFLGSDCSANLKGSVGLIMTHIGKFKMNPAEPMYAELHPGRPFHNDRVHLDKVSPLCLKRATSFRSALGNR